MALETPAKTGKAMSREEAEKVAAMPEWARQPIEWHTAVQETGDQIVFDTIGDEFVGMFNGPQTAEKEGEEFTILTFEGTDGKPYQTNAGWKLERAFVDIPTGTVVRITYVKDIDVNQPSPLKDFRVDIAYRKADGSYGL